MTLVIVRLPNKDGVSYGDTEKVQTYFFSAYNQKIFQGAVLSEAKKESRFFFAGENLDKPLLKINASLKRDCSWRGSLAS